MPTVRPGVLAKYSDDIVILGCINEHDGSGYIHALLHAYHPSYSRLKSDHYRTSLAKSIRIGALPSILKMRYGTDPLCREGCSEARFLFNTALSYGTSLPEVLLQDYAMYLQAPYRLYDSDINLIEEYYPEDNDNRPACNIINTLEDEYHLIVKLNPDMSYQIMTSRQEIP